MKKQTPQTYLYREFRIAGQSIKQQHDFENQQRNKLYEFSLSEDASQSVLGRHYEDSSLLQKSLMLSFVRKDRQLEKAI